MRIIEKELLKKKKEYIADACADVLKEMLPVLDNLRKSCCS